MYSFESRVRYSECTEDAKLSIESLINYLQDCSTFQSEQLGVGIDFMKAHHFAWFISAWQISIDRLPRFCEPITISPGQLAFAARSTTQFRYF
jgi:acyl-ACP thioesterase